MSQVRARQTAFTLLELLVVMFIIGTMAAMLVPRLFPDSRDGVVRDESRRLLQLMRLAGEDAVLRNQSIGVNFDHDGYRFMRRINDKWEVIDDDDLYRSRKLPDDMLLELTVEGGKLKQVNNRPQAIFLSTGEVTPVVITLIHRELDRRFHISGNFFTAMQLEVEDV